jgi:hypothetical protein
VSDEQQPQADERIDRVKRPNTPSKLGDLAVRPGFRNPANKGSKAQKKRRKKTRR